jgi:formyltetrahydrofolate synthetase
VIYRRAPHAAICGDIMTIPGLPTRPGFYDVDIDTKTGRVIGLF